MPAARGPVSDAISLIRVPASAPGFSNTFAWESAKLNALSLLAPECKDPVLTCDCSQVVGIWRVVEIERHETDVGRQGSHQAPRRKKVRPFSAHKHREHASRLGPGAALAYRFGYQTMPSDFRALSGRSAHKHQVIQRTVAKMNSANPKYSPEERSAGRASSPLPPFSAEMREW